MKNLFKRQQGFTIIEVMIVLAIAGIILLIVFLAVPAVQRNTRNVDRKEAVSFVAAAMDEYRTTHAQYPATPDEVCDFLANYAPGRIGTQTSGCPASYTGAGECITVTYSRYNICYHDYDSAPHSYLGDSDEISIMLSHWCNSGPHADHVHDGNNPVTSGGAAIDNMVQRYVVWIKLEGSGVVCVDNFPS